MLLGKHSDEAQHWQQSNAPTQCIISNETLSKMPHRTEESPRNRGTEKKPHVVRGSSARTIFFTETDYFKALRK